MTKEAWLAAVQADETLNFFSGRFSAKHLLSTVFGDVLVYDDGDRDEEYPPEEYNDDDEEDLFTEEYEDED